MSRYLRHYMLRMQELVARRTALGPVDARAIDAEMDRLYEEFVTGARMPFDERSLNERLHRMLTLTREEMSELRDRARR